MITLLPHERRKAARAHGRGYRAQRISKHYLWEPPRLASVVVRLEKEWRVATAANVSSMGFCPPWFSPRFAP
jgi:phage-related protein